MINWGVPLEDVEWFWRAGLEYPFLAITAGVAVFIVGACLGSFLNVCIWRMPRGESVVNAPSHCTGCGMPIRWFDNLPVVSYLALRGRCRRCHQPYSPRYLVVETLTGLLFVAIFFKSGLLHQTPCRLPAELAMTMLAISAAWIDAEHRLIPDALTLPAATAGLIFAAIFPAAWNLTGDWSAGNAAAAALMSALSGILAGGLLGAFTWIGYKWTGRDVIGWGDVKFVAATATLLGLPAAMFILLIGSILGLIWGIISACRHHRRLHQLKIAFGPFLSAATLIWIFTGSKLYTGYAQLIALLIK